MYKSIKSNMKREKMQRDNSRYCRKMGPLAERSYEVDMSNVGPLLSVPMEDLVSLGLAPEWDQFAFISSKSFKSPRGKYAFLAGADSDTFRSVYEQSTGVCMKTHAKVNGKPLHVSRLMPFNAKASVPCLQGVPEQVPYPCGDDVSSCTDVSVRNPFLQSVTDFVMYMTLRYIISNHSVQGPKLLDTRYTVLRAWIRSKTPLLSGTFYDDKTRMMWVFEFRMSFPVCPTCHREFGRLVNVHLSAKYPAYQPHCSSRCAATDPRVAAKLEASSMERFGVKRPSMSKDVIAKTRRTLVERYGTDCTFKDERIKEKSRETSRRRYGTDYPAQNPEIAAKSVDTLLRRYGASTPLRVPEFLAKAKATLRAKYGSDSPLGNKEVLERARATRFSSMRRENCIPVEGGFLDNSKWERIVYDICVKHGLEFRYHPVLLEFEFDGKIHHYEPDFEINGRLYECKGDHLIRPDGKWQSVYDHSKDGLYEAKHQCAIRNNVRILTAFDMQFAEDIILHPELDNVDGQGYSVNRARAVTDVSEKKCFGLTDDEVVRICMESEFPGTLTWPADHPIWDCNVRGRISPREAWGRPSYIQKAVANMFSMINREVYGVRRDTKFIDSHRSAFEKCIAGDRSELLLKVLNRFTIARIAPKVTALHERLFLKIVDESGFDISNGIYCPMAGFGGIVRGARKWMRDRGIDPSGKVYAADINPSLCRRYGWLNKDVLSEVVETDRIVVACPPFSDTEQWPGTPSESYIGFHEWARLVREHVRAPGYILIGPSERYVREKDRNGRTLSPMFAHREQARYYPEYRGGTL